MSALTDFWIEQHSNPPRVHFPKLAKIIDDRIDNDPQIAFFIMLSNNPSVHSLQAEQGGSVRTVATSSVVSDRREACWVAMVVGVLCSSLSLSSGLKAGITNELSCCTTLLLLG